MKEEPDVGEQRVNSNKVDKLERDNKYKAEITLRDKKRK